jgi:tetratricopeptide (TPR) repeat protein
MKISLIKSSLILLLFAALSFLIYSNTLNVPFVFDDVLRIQENEQVRIENFSFAELREAAFAKKCTENRPVANITFALNYYLHQYNLPGYHVVNIVIHILTGFFMYFFIRITLLVLRAEKKGSTSESTNPSFIAFLAALFWLVNPVHTQSVTYIVQRQNSLAAMFFVISFLFYVKGRISQRQSSGTAKLDKNTKGNLQKGKSLKLKAQSRTIALNSGSKLNYLWFAGSGLTWILALGCKENAATLPFFAILYEWYFFQDLSREWLKNNLKYFLGIFILFCLIAVLYLGSDPLEMILKNRDYARGEFTFSERVLTQFRVVIYYLGLLFYPHPSRLRLDYDFPLSHSLINPVTTLLSLGAIIGLIVLAFYLAKKDRLISFCIFWFFGNLIIESTVIPLAIIYEHRTYLPSMFVCLLVVILAFRYIRQKWVVVGFMCAVVFVFSIWTYQRNMVWKDAVTLWSDNVNKSPKKFRPRMNLADALFKQGKLEKAIFHFQEAIKMDPENEKAHLLLGKAFNALGRVDEAIHHYSEALRIKPEYPEALVQLGNALESKGNSDGAIRHYVEALRIKPDYEGALNNMGVALMRQGRLEDAFYYFSEVVRINPEFVQAYNNMGYILAQQNRTEEAIRNYKKAISIEPDFVQALNNLAVAYTGKGEYDKAIALFKKIIRLRPTSPIVYYYMASIYSEQNKIQDSIDCIKNAIRTGFKDWELIKTDKNLQNLRNSQSFKEFLKNSNL